MEMKEHECPSCGQKNSPYGVVNNAQQYRCAKCGMVYYGPSECADDPDAPAGEQAAKDDWPIEEPKSED